MAEEPPGPNGGYMTRGRALELERKMAALEARTDEKIARLERDVADTRTFVVDALRAQANAILSNFKSVIGR